MPLDLSRHPCFHESARHRFARVHLPVAPRCNVQCNFCRHGLDCMNESRPGVTSALLTPPQALEYLKQVLAQNVPLSVVGIAGPGDPFANAEETLTTLRLVRQHYPDMLLCVASNGLDVAPHAPALGELDLSHVTLTINAVDPEIGAKIYAWIRCNKRVYRGVAGAELLLERQLKAIRALKSHGVTVKINTIVVPGVNDAHVDRVAETTAALGADLINCVPFYQVADTPFASIESPSPERIAEIRAQVGQRLPVMQHCTRCRADAVGLLGQSTTPALNACLMQASQLPLVPAQERPYVAVATREGVLVNQHLGEALELSIFARDEAGFRLVETRPAPPAGGGERRWQALAEVLHDCRALLAASAGLAPRAALSGQGVRVMLMEGLIEEGLEAVYRSVEIRAPLRRKHHCGAGATCSGNGEGCG